MMKKLLPGLICASLALTASFSSQAHRAWFLPAATVLSGDEPWVTIDAAVSNDIFHADHAPMRLKTVKVKAANGEQIELKNANTGKYRSTFDLELTQEGTYKVFLASNGLRARWIKEDGSRGFWPGRGQPSIAEDFVTKVPQDAKDLSVSYSSYRIETFVTVGTPSEEVFTPENEGLELVPVTHPNDLYATETAKFRFLIDGEPAANAKVTVLAGGMRYRNSQEEMILTTDKQGEFSVTWPEAGMYWMNARYEDAHAKAPATTRKGSYSATFEVLPQ